MTVALFIDPTTPHFERDRLFDVEFASWAGDRILEPYAFLRESLGRRGIRVHTADLLEDGGVAPADVNVYVSMGIRDRYPKLAKRADVVASAFFALEVPIVEPRLYLDLDQASTVFKRLFSYSTAQALRQFLRRPLEFHGFRIPQSFDAVHEDAWSVRDRRFLAMINSNKLPRLDTNELYSERLRAIEFFGRRDEIDLYGTGWDGPPYRVGETRVPRPFRTLRHRVETRLDRLRPDRDPLIVAARRAFRGRVESKSQTLTGYTFSICFENMVLEGWVTEKIFDCLRVGTIPVYLGAPDIERWVWPECFVDASRFADYEDLGEFLHGLSRRDLDAYRDAAREYFSSDEFQPFTKSAFVRIFEKMIEEDAGVPP